MDTVQGKDSYRQITPFILLVTCAPAIRNDNKKKKKKGAKASVDYFLKSLVSMMPFWKQKQKNNPTC